MDTDKIAKFNKLLENPNPVFDSHAGYEVLIAGIAKGLPETYGENVAKNFAYQLGGTSGQKIADRILGERKGKLFEDPLEAVFYLFAPLKKYYQCELNDQKLVGDNCIEIHISIRTYLDELLARRPELVTGGILSMINRGYVEVALKKLTGKKVTFDQDGVRGKICFK